MAGTAIICILAAFGAAFLVARAVKHQAPARAATLPRTTRVAATLTSTTPARVNAELVSQFSPVPASSLKHRPKPHHRHRPKPKPAPPPPTPVVTQTATTPAPAVTSTPVYSAPVQSAPVQSHPTSSGSTTRKKKSSGGSGTTTIGG